MRRPPRPGSTRLTDAGGAYAINLPAGNYKLLIQPNTAGYPDHWYGGRRFATATTVVVDGANTVNITVTGRPSPWRARSQDGGAGRSRRLRDGL